MNHKEIIEAALFVAGDGVNIRSLAKIVNIPEKNVIDTLRSLMEEYNIRETGLEIVETGEKRYVMQVKPRYSDVVSRLAPGEIKSPVLRTLSMVAYHQPIAQSELVDIRGNSAYEHIRELKDRGLVKAAPHGRTKILQTTTLFAEYFGIDSNDPESIRKKIIELSRKQSGSVGLDRWLGRRVVAVTPMYESLMQICGITDYRVINAYSPDEDELDSLADVYRLIVSRGYSEQVSRYYDGEIIEIGSVTFSDLIDSIQSLEDIYDPDQARESIEKINELRERYVSKAMVIDRKVKPATDMISRIVSDLHIGISSAGVVIAPDYGVSSNGVDVSDDAQILVPTHEKEGSLIERVCRKYDAVIDGLKE